MELDLDLDEFCKKFLGWKMINKKGKFGGWELVEISKFDYWCKKWGVLKCLRRFKDYDWKNPETLEKIRDSKKNLHSIALREHFSLHCSELFHSEIHWFELHQAMKFQDIHSVAISFQTCAGNLRIPNKTQPIFHETLVKLHSLHSNSKLVEVSTTDDLLHL
jgi:hypothetical protein